MKIIVFGEDTVELVLNADEVARMLDGEEITKHVGDKVDVDLSGVENWLVSACG